MVNVTKNLRVVLWSNLAIKNLDFPYLNTDYRLTEPVLSFWWARRCYCSMLVPAAARGRWPRACQTLPGTAQLVMVQGWRDHQGEAAFNRPGPHCWPGTEPPEMLEPDPSRQRGLCKYIPLISTVGPTWGQGWKVRNQVPGLSIMQMGWCLQTDQDCSVHGAWWGLLQPSKTSPGLLTKFAWWGSENLRSGWKEKGKKWELERKQWLQVVGEHQQEQKSDKACTEVGWEGVKHHNGAWRDRGEMRRSGLNACASLVVNDSES